MGLFKSTVLAQAELLSLSHLRLSRQDAVHGVSFLRLKRPSMFTSTSV